MSDGFGRSGYAMVSFVSYAIAFYLLSLTLKTIPLGVAYAVWSGVGIALITTIGWIAFDQRVDGVVIAGMALIVLGVLLINMRAFGVGQG